MTKKLQIRFEITAEIEVDESTEEFNMGRYVGTAEREMVKVCEEVTGHYKFNPDVIRAEIKRIL